MQPDDHIVASNKVYGGTVTQFTRSFAKFVWSATLVDPDDPENFRRAITPATKMIFVESLANPGGVVVDLEKVAAIEHAAGIRSEEHTSELQSLMRISYADFCLKKKRIVAHTQKEHH